LFIIKIVVITLLTLFIPFRLCAEEYQLNIDPQKEIEILESMDIDPLFYNDEYYIQTKEKINQLKRLYFLKTLKRGNLFMPNLQELLNEADIPNTFLYMAMVESKFLADSKSHKHAAGLWQFMPATAKEYKLKKNRHIDERLDPIKSTKAAIEYLKYLHSRFKKWYLAAMAYNCGESRLAQAINKAGTDDLAVLLDEKKGYLPKETRDYIRRIIVAALLAHDKNIIKKNNKNHLFGFCSNKKLTKLYFKGGESLHSIAFKIGVPYQKLKACNPHLIKDRLPPNKKMYYVYLPEDLAKKAQEKIKESGETFVYYVQPNDTLFRISKRFNIKMNALKSLNPQLRKHKILKIGMPLTLLGKEPKGVQKQQQLSPAKKNKVIKYTLSENSTLYETSLKFNNTIAILKKLNPGIGKKLTKGTTIKIIQGIEINTSNESNITTTFKTKEITNEQNDSQKETNATKPLKISEESNTSKNKRPKVLPFRYKTITYVIDKNDTLETIAGKFNLKVKDLLKEGNVMIIKIKENLEHNRSHEDQKNNIQ